jgi:hypothetical protein
LGIRLLFRNRLLRIPRTPDPRMIESCLLTQYLIMMEYCTPLEPPSRAARQQRPLPPPRPLMAMSAELCYGAELQYVIARCSE